MEGGLFNVCGIAIPGGGIIGATVAIVGGASIVGGIVGIDPPIGAKIKIRNLNIHYAYQNRVF